MSDLAKSFDTRVGDQLEMTTNKPSLNGSDVKSFVEGNISVDADR